MYIVDVFVIIICLLQGDVPSPRAAHAAACMKDKVFLFGGRHGDERLNDLYLMDLQTLFWTR